MISPCPHGLRVTNCKPCRRQYKTAKQTEYNDQALAEQITAGVRRCNSCGIVKPFDQFEPDKRKRLGIVGRCKQCNNKARRDRYHKKVASGRERQRESEQETRRQAIAIYGGRCESCGGTEKLEFDHVNGDGGEHRKVEGHNQMLRRIVAADAQITDYQLRLLCAPCHRPLYTGPSRQRLTLMMAGANNWPAQLPIGYLRA